MGLLAVFIYVLCGLAVQSIYYRFSSRAFSREPYWKTFFGPYKVVGAFKHKTENGAIEYPEKFFIAKAAQRYWLWLFFWINAGMIIVPQLASYLEERAGHETSDNRWLAFVFSSGAAMLVSLVVLMAFLAFEAVMLFVFVMIPANRVGKIKKAVQMENRAKANAVQKQSALEPGSAGVQNDQNNQRAD